jgi:hypothetical protein
MANNITKVFTYNLPDDYLSQVRTLGKTAKWTYIGPDEVCLVIKKDTNRYAGKFLTHDHDKDTVPVAIDEYHVHVDCASHPLLCCLANTETEQPDYADLDQHEELLPDGLTYKRPLNPPPDHTHDINDIEFNPNGDVPAQLTFPWKAPHSTWEAIRYWRNTILTMTDDKQGEHLEDMPATLATKWNEYRQNLRDLPQTHGGENIHVYIDLTAAAPLNTQGHSLIKVTDATDIHVGDDIGVRGWPVTDCFSEHTKVIGVNLVTKVVELSAPLVSTPTETNSEIACSPCPHTDPWKIGALTAPDGQGGPLDKHGNLENPTAVGNVIKKFW